MPGPVAFFDIRGRPHSANGKFTSANNASKKYICKPNPEYVKIQAPRRKRKDAGIKRGPRGLTLQEQIKGLKDMGVPREQIRDFYLTKQSGMGRRKKRTNMRGGSIQGMVNSAIGAVANLHPISSAIYNTGQRVKPASRLSEALNNSRYANTTAGKVGNAVLSPLKWLGFGPIPRRRRRKAQRGRGPLKQNVRATIATLAAMNPMAQRLYNLGTTHRPAKGLTNAIKNSTYANTRLGTMAVRALKPMKWLGFGPVPRKTMSGGSRKRLAIKL